ncbi:SAM-dependent methyltransferase [Streptomyces californicus]
MLENRRFMHRAARYLAEEQGVRQFLDVGTGLPTSPNLHEIVQEVAPESHVVYVDNDPIVLAHARALLESSPEGATAYVDANMHDPEAILESTEFRELIDLERPVGLMVIGIMHFILPPDDRRLVQRLLDPLPSGSYLAMTIGTGDFAPQEVGRVAEEYRQQGMPMALRDLATATSFFDGLELVDPAVTQVHTWRPGPEQDGVDGRDIAMYGAVARKPETAGPGLARGHRMGRARPRRPVAPRRRKGPQGSGVTAARLRRPIGTASA